MTAQETAVGILCTAYLTLGATVLLKPTWVMVAIVFVVAAFIGITGIILWSGRPYWGLGNIVTGSAFIVLGLAQMLS